MGQNQAKGSQGGVRDPSTREVAVNPETREEKGRGEAPTLGATGGKRPIRKSKEDSLQHDRLNWYGEAGNDRPNLRRRAGTTAQAHASRKRSHSGGSYRPPSTATKCQETQLRGAGGPNLKKSLLTHFGGTLGRKENVGGVLAGCERRGKIDCR